MAVYYKFKSAKDYDSIPIDGHFISVANLKEKIFESKHLGRGTDFDLMVSNAQTNEDYLDEAMLIPKNTSVVVRRVPGRPRMPIVTERDQTKMEEIKVEDAQLEKGSFHSVDSSVMKYPEETEWDEFGNDLYSIPEVQPVQLSNPVQDALPNRADEDSKIKALIDTPALDWQRQAPDGFSSGRGFGRGMGGRMMGGRGFGRGGIERKTPPQGYVCHRCKVPGHFIQHCPTNGDPNYDIRRVKPPTGIPKSMLMATPDGSYALPSGAVAVLRPNEAAFEKEIEGLPSTKSVSDLPPELRCPLCKEVMKDAVLTSKCCFNSFCDKCIREHIISKSMCVCGATNILTDDLLPNKTLRDTINRILESNNSSAENVGSMVQVQDVESARCPVPKVPSPALSFGSKAEQMPATTAASNGEQMLPCHSNGTPDIKKTINEDKTASSAPQQLLGKDRQAKTADVSGATLESASVREPTSQGSVPLADEEVQQRLATGEPGKKKKKKKARLPVNATDMQWRTAQDLAAENYMFPFAPSGYNPYWADMQLGMNNYMNPFAGSMPYMGYTPGPFDVPYGGMLPQDPFAGQSYMFPPVPPQRDLSELAMGAGAAPAILSREEFEARKADLRRKREIERRGERECSKDKEGGREVNSNDDVSSMKSKHRPSSEALVSSADHHRHRAERVLTPERSTRGAEPVRSGKRKSEERQELRQTESGAQKRSVFARISFPDSSSGNKKRKETPNGYKDDYDGPAAASTHHKPPPNGYHHDERRHSTVKTTSVSASGGRKSAVDHDSSDDDDRHFKRRPSRYEPPPVEWEEDVRPSRGSSERERERDRDRSSRDHERGYSKHR